MASPAEVVNTTSVPMVPTVGVSVPDLSEVILPESYLQRFSQRPLFPVEEAFYSSELGQSLQARTQMPAYLRTSLGRNADHDRLTHSLLAADICYEFCKNASVVDNSGRHVSKGIPIEELELGTLCSAIHDWRHAAWSHQLAEQLERLGVQYDHDHDRTQPHLEAKFDQMLSRHGFHREEIEAVFKKQDNPHPLGCVVKAIADRLSYLYLDSVAAGMSENGLKSLWHAMHDICKNGVFVRRGAAFVESEVGVDKCALSSIKELARARQFVFENAGWRPETMASWSFLVDATERALSSGRIESPQSLRVKLLEGADEDIISALHPFDQEVLTGSHVDEIFDPVIGISFSGLEGGKSSPLLQSSLRLRGLVIDALNCSELGAGGLVPEHEIIVGHTPTYTKDLQYKIYEGNGVINRVTFKSHIPDDQCFLFVAIHNEAGIPANRDSEIKARVRSKVLEKLTPFITPAANTDEQIFGRPNTNPAVPTMIV